MSSFTQRLAVMQEAIDNTSIADLVNHPSHGAMSMVKEGYLRPFGAGTNFVAMTENGFKWGRKMQAAGFLTGLAMAAAAIVPLPQQIGDILSGKSLDQYAQ